MHAGFLINIIACKKTFKTQYLMAHLKLHGTISSYRSFMTGMYEGRHFSVT
jgi:hypothetical protein